MDQIPWRQQTNNKLSIFCVKVTMKLITFILSVVFCPLAFASGDYIGLACAVLTIFITILLFLHILFIIIPLFMFSRKWSQSNKTLEEISKNIAK